MNDILATLQQICDYFKPRITWPVGPPLKLLMLGLDGSGKTTFLYRLNQLGGGKNKIKPTMPNITLYYEELKFHGGMIISRDVGGRDRLSNIISRKLGHLENVDGIIFMVDCNDECRLDEARDQLHFNIDQDELSGGRAPLLVICNKQDLPNAVPPDKIANILDVPGIQRKWQAFGTAGTSGDGIKEAFKWLVTTIRSKDKLDTDTVTTDDSTAVSESSFSSTLDMTGIGYDPTAKGKNQTLNHFLPIKQGTECPFAKSALLWGGSTCLAGSTIEDQAKANIAALSEFVHRSKSGEKLHGFCIELVHDLAREGSPRELGECVRRMLTVLSDNDPAGEGLMTKRYIGNRGWRFRFDRADFFITTFAPCYPSSSSRYAFGTGRAFLLLQPMVSFESLLSPDTPKTNWDAPKTMRDKARVAFRDAGRVYHIPETTIYPPAEHIVKPLDDDGTSIISWWKPL